MATKPKVEYTKPTSQLDLEARLSAEDEGMKPLFPTQNPTGEPTEDGYLGTDAVYQNYANDTEKPLAAEEGADQLAEEAAEDAYGDGSEAPSEEVQKKYDEDVNVHAKMVDASTSDEK